MTIFVLGPTYSDGSIMKIGLIIIWIMLGISSVNAKIDQSVLGRTFKVFGPNCFSAALRVTQHYVSFRGVDEPEFREFVNLYCTPVVTPDEGDIGAYINPSSGQFVHAFVYLDPIYGIDKPGADYMGQTMVALKPIESIHYLSFASPECRKHSYGRIDLCSNQLQYFNCNSSGVMTDPIYNLHNEKVLKWEQEITKILETNLTTKDKAQIKLTLAALLTRIFEDFKLLENTQLSNQKLTYLKARYESLKIQLYHL